MLGEKNIKVANFPGKGGRGLAATHNILAGETILALPINELISVKTIKEILHPVLYNKIFEFGNLFDSEVYEEAELLILTVFMMLEVQKPESPLKTYIEQISEQPS